MKCDYWLLIRTNTENVDVFYKYLSFNIVIDSFIV